jgi:hypothetical protein
LEHLQYSLIRIDLADTQNFGTRGSEVQILSPRPTHLKSLNYEHRRYASDAYSNGFRSHYLDHMFFIINNLATGMSPYEATRGSGGVPQVRAPFVGVVEIVCGSLLLMGLVTWLARCRFSLILRSPNIRPKSSRREELGFYRLRKHGAFVDLERCPVTTFLLPEPLTKPVCTMP